AHEAAALVERYAGERRHQLHRGEPRAACLGLAVLEQHPGQAVTRVRGVYEERADPGRLGARVEIRLVPLCTRTAAKERTPPTPAAAGDDLARGRDDCEVGAVLDQRSIDPKGALQRPFDLRIRVITGAQRAGGARDESTQRWDVYRSGEAEREAH